MRQGKLGRLAMRGETPALLIGAMAFLFFALATRKFATPYNLGLLLNQTAIYGMLGVGLTLVIIVGGMDISIGATLSLCCAVMGIIWERGKGLPDEALYILLGIGASVLIGAAVGALLGAMITLFKIPDMVASLAIQRITRGLAIAISGGKALSKFPKAVYNLGIAKFLGLGLPFWIFVIFTLVLTVVLGLTRFGRRIYMLGNNATAAQLAGIDTAKTRFFVYLAEGIIVGLCAIVYLSYNFYAMASTTGNSILTYVLASVLMGGASMDGGKGTAVGTLLGAFALVCIMNGLIHIGASANAVDVIVALLIMTVLLFQYLARAMPGRWKRKEVLLS